MPKKIEKFAIICWTHASLDGRPPIEVDCPPEVACELSQTIRAQYEGAKARIEGIGEVTRTFFFEEAGHRPSVRVTEEIMDAVAWCKATGSTPVINDLSEHPGRSFQRYKNLIADFRADLIEIMFFEAEPDETHLIWRGKRVSIAEYFAANREQEAEVRRQRRRERLELHRLRALRRSIRRGAKVGFAAEWNGKAEAAERGRKTQRERALGHAENVMRLITSIRRSKPDVSFNKIAEILNGKAQHFPDFKPSRAASWSADSIRMMVCRHEKRLAVKSPRDR